MAPIDVFVSHASEDSNTAVQLASHLESSGYRTWFYERDATAGVPPLLQIKWAISNCRAVVVVVSPRTARSGYVRREVVRAMELDKEFIPFLVDLTRSDLEQRQELIYEAMVLATAIEASSSTAASAFPKVLDGLALLHIMPLPSGTTRSFGRQQAIAPASPPNTQTPTETGLQLIEAQAPLVSGVREYEPPKPAAKNRHPKISELHTRERSCREDGNVPELKHVLIDLARALREGGGADRALPRLREAERHARDTEDWHCLSASLGEQASAYVDLDKIPPAMAKLKEHQRLCLELGIDNALQWNLGIQGLLLQDHGDVYRAREYYARQEWICHNRGDHRGLTISLVSQAVLLAESSTQLGDAMRLARDARAEVVRHGFSDLAAWVEAVSSSIASGAADGRTGPTRRPPADDVTHGD